jgi:hypothetical protein
VRERHFSYLRRSFAVNDAEELRALLFRIDEQSVLISAVDVLVKNILTTESLVEPPNIQ